MGKKVLVDLSHPFGATSPLWPYFQAPQISKLHYMAKSGVLTQQITATMHCSTHADSPAHVVEGTEFTHEIPLDKYYGDAVCVHIEKPEWGVITAEDLEAATPEIRKGDIVIVHTGWHKYYGDNTKYYHYAPGLGRSAGEWFVKKGVKAVGVDQQALDHPLHTAIGPHGTGPLVPRLMDEYRERTGREVKDDFPEWEPCHNLILGNGIMGYENVGGDIEKVVGKRFKIMGFPIRWYMGDGSWVRLVAEIDEDDLNPVPDRVYKYGTY
ncbi:MAG: cyclase family protein [Rubrivivax sp.]|uniref:Putative cyclase n=1 Tax=Rubrivivax gelatinosus (strain NBRC 100245 / IL144) TaxID=983917 RepID=I0HKD8_RUBGI|nr:cyclase family protein [Rubrivivax gelatinosus]BAL93475.1 putative cyclase [Rubrivivax gelatinosus IL144]